MKPIVVISLCAAVLVLEGCAASRALDQPHEKNLDVLKPGSERDLVRAELGAPLPSSTGNSCDVFAFPEGSTGWRYLRALSYSVLDVGTLGLSEIVTNPVESSVGKSKIQLRVCYNSGQQVLYTERLEAGVPAKLVTGAYPPVPPPVAVDTAVLPAVAPAAADTATPPVATPAVQPSAAITPTGTQEAAPQTARN